MRQLAYVECAGMSRLIFLIAIIAVVYFLLRSYRKSASRNDASPISEEMVRCVECGVHLPKSESILSSGEFFCSEAHRRDRASRNK